MASTDIQTQTVEQAASGSPQVPKSRMTATWHTKPREEWGFFGKLLHDLHVVQDPHGSEAPPVFSKDAPVPVWSMWSQHAWVLPRALPPLVLNIAYTLATGKSIPKYIAGPLYVLYFINYGTVVMSSLRRMTKAYGFFDGEKPRDGIPDLDVGNVTRELVCVVGVRSLFAAIFIYPSDQSTMLNWKTVGLLPLNLFMYSVILDFWFYWYHRLMHEVDFLWRFHQKHHRTKHPNASLAAFADHEQEVFDILIIPMLTYLVWPVDFPTWWLCQAYVLFLEAAGHSGMRAWISNPTTWPLTLLGSLGNELSLLLEDHDLHHRQGWKKSGNYGKQTRVWDCLFGTCRDRIECVEGNIDWNNKIKNL